MTKPPDICPGCKAALPPQDGPVHAYMTATPACWARFNALLGAEFSDPSLMQVHRLTVDTYAVQHPGDGVDRRAIQSVGLHLARLCVQLAAPRPPRETNEVMLGFAEHKATLIALEPPARFRLTVADVAPFAGTAEHAERVQDWAQTTWEDWCDHHAYIQDWITRHPPR